MTAILGGMVPQAGAFTVIEPNNKVLADGHAEPAWRAELRQIPNLRNSVSVSSIYLQAGAILWLTLRLNHPISYLFAFILMGRTHAQMLALMHESAHRLLFRSHRLNDFVGRWLVGYISFTNTDGYRRVHMAHHREEFGPNEPDIPLYANYPITRASFWRKMRRDALGLTGIRLLRDQLSDAVRVDSQKHNSQRRIFFFHIVVFVLSVVFVNPYLYVGLWLLPYLTVWRVMNRLRSIAEHGGLRADDDRRVASHAVRQHLLPRFFFVPFNLGWHVAHHIDSGIPFRSLPKYHSQLRVSGYVTDDYEYSNYRSIWRALRANQSHN